MSIFLQYEIKQAVFNVFLKHNTLFSGYIQRNVH